MLKVDGNTEFTKKKGWANRLLFGSVIRMFKIDPYFLTSKDSGVMSSPNGFFGFSGLTILISKYVVSLEVCTEYPVVVGSTQYGAPVI